MSGGSNTSYPTAPLAGLWTGANQAFQPVPYPGTSGAASSALNQIQAPWTNQIGGWSPAGQAGAGQGLTQAAQQFISGTIPQLTQNIPALNSLGMNYLNAAGGAGVFPSQAARQMYAQLDPYVSQIMQTGFDPQKALYNRTLQQVQDQAQAANAAAGVGTTPYGAGLTNQATENFNIDWQNQQLARQAQAAQAAGGLSSSIMGDIQSGWDTMLNARMTDANIGLAALGLGGTLGNTAGNLLGTAANVVNTGQGLGQGGASFLNQLSQQQIQNLLTYLQQSSANAGNWAAATGNFLGGANNLYGTQAAVNQNNLQNLMSSLGGLGGLLGQGIGAGLKLL